MSHHPGYDQKPRSRYAVISGEQTALPGFYVAIGASENQFKNT